MDSNGGRRRRFRGRMVALVPALALATLTGLAAPAATPVALAQQEATPMAAPQYPATVSVSGQGSVNVPPDTATVMIGIDVIRPELGEAQAEAARQATAIIDAVQTAGVGQRDIQTANYSVNILRDYSSEGNPTDVTGFEVMNQVNVTIRDVEGIGDLLDAVVGAGANSIYGVQFFVDDPRPFSGEARTQAVEDATEKARQLAEAAGMDLGRVVSIAEGFNSAPIPYPAMGRGGGMADAAMETPIQTGTSQITVDVNMTFELEEAAS